MMCVRGANMLKIAHPSKSGIARNSIVRHITTPSGSILPEPKMLRFGYLKVASAIAIGVSIGATISKHIANFLEENELFVPSDDDDDD